MDKLNGTVHNYLHEYKNTKETRKINVYLNKSDKDTFIARIDREYAHNFDVFLVEENEYPIVINCNICPYITEPQESHTLKLNGECFIKETDNDCNPISCYRVVHCINEINKKQLYPRDRLKNIIELFSDIPESIKDEEVYEYLMKLREKRFYTSCS